MEKIRAAPLRVVKGENGFNYATRVLRVTPYETGSRQVSAIHWRRVIEFTRRKARFRSERRFLVRRRAFSNFLLRIDDGVSHPRAQFASLVQMDPAEERRDRKRQQEYFNMLGNVADSQYGIPRRFPCGGRIIDEVRVEEYDTLPGKRFFTCINYEVH
ncbi:hypothetical protein IGI04_033440 [Brassica rapa subsp. trilocularis]|uniref:Uncharacterized protein n=1 Tax=Brassica rapa subsp. trilocularis TaxID=1813537 RepID=A0ABQ7L8P1_BRACM|nr:hypothetical protein IGI04_033440 [Brassica rapa subsp. trilocularis]